MVIFQKSAFYGYFSAKLTIFLCFNAKGSYPKHPKGIFSGEGGGPFDHTWGWGMNFTDNGRAATSFHLFVLMGGGTVSQVQSTNNWYNLTYNLILNESTLSLTCIKYNYKFTEIRSFN